MTKADAVHLLAHTKIPTVLLSSEVVPMPMDSLLREVTELEECAYLSQLYYRSEHDGAWPVDKQAYAEWLLTYTPPKNMFDAELRRRAQHGER